MWLTLSKDLPKNSSNLARMLYAVVANPVRLLGYTCLEDTTKLIEEAV